VIIVTYNSVGVIGACLTALTTGFEESTEVIVVDNASEDNSVEFIRERHPGVLIIANSTNVGFASAVNIGAKRARGEYLVLLNPDATVSHDVLNQLIATVGANTHVGVIAPWLEDPTGRISVASAGRDPFLWRMFCHYSGMSRLFGRARCFEGHYLLPRHLGARRDVDWVTGACLVVSRRVWNTVGGMSERWFMYAEDLEFCRKVRRAGYSVVFDPTLSATHLVGESAAGNRRSSNPAWVVNLYDFYSSELTERGIDRLAWRLVVAIGLYSRAIAYAVRAKIHPKHRDEWEWESKRFRHFGLSALNAHRESR
jgi:hypothetical protein